MAETQLREAFMLMKQGQKGEAARLVRDVLQKDSRNSYAWWLLSHLLDDEDDVVKALENVLTLNPEHPNVRQKLAALRPEYAHLNEAHGKNKNAHKPESYWEKIDNPSKRRRLSPQLSEPVQFVMGRIVVGMLIFAAIGVYSYISFLGGPEAFNFPEEGEVHAEILADTPNTPEGVARAFLEAYYLQSEESLYVLSCPAYHSEVDLMAENFNNPWAWQTEIDFAQTRFVADIEGDYAFVSLHGIMQVEERGVSVRTDWDEVARSNGAEEWGYSLTNINGQWLVCPVQ